MTVIPLATPLTVEAAWQRYVDLVRANNDDPALYVRVEHQMAIARAWREWRDLFLVMDERKTA